MSVESATIGKDRINTHELKEKRVPVPRYTYPILIGLAVSFRKEVAKEIKRGGLVERVGTVATYGVALNEAADIGVSAELKLQSCRQEQFVPLLQVRKRLFEELERRKSRFMDSYPELGYVIDVAENDFLILSRKRGRFDPRAFNDFDNEDAERDLDKINPITFNNIDSGIFEAMFTETALPGLLQSAGIDFPGERCATVEDLLEKYNIYTPDYTNTKTQSSIVKRIRRLHGFEMLMKLSDDIEGWKEDKLPGILNTWSYIADKAKEEGRNPRDIYNEHKMEYLRMVGTDVFTKTATNGALWVFDASGRIKDAKGCKGVSATDDLWQLPRLVERSFHPGCTTLRHELEASGLLNRAFTG